MKEQLRLASSLFYKAILIAVFSFLVAGTASAQISMTASPTSYSQNFDGLSATSPSTNVTWTDNVTIPGWFTNQGNYRTWSTGDATPSNRIWACGTALGNTDRALGSIMTSTTLRVWGVKLTNNTGAAMAAIGIGFDAEQYYSAGTGANFLVQYSTTGAIDDAVTSTSWTTIATITSPATGLNYALSGLNLATGATVTIRWISAYGGSSSNVALWATDNFTASWGLPAVTTVSATQTGQTTATANGNITGTGGFASLIASGVCYSSTVTVPTIADSKTTDGILTTGAYTSNMTNLTAGTLYHVRAYATNAVGTSYGAVIDITTAVPTLATLTTAAASAITPVSALSGGNISNDGGRSITARGICWSTSANPTTANSFVTSGTGTGSFTSLLSVLTASTLYHARAFATNSVGTAYGNDIQFTTLPAAPTIVVNPTSLAFGTVQQGTTSPEKTYTLAAYYLTPAAGNLTVTAPAGYQISLTTGTGFKSVLTIPYTSGTLPTTTIYVRFSPTSLSNYNKKITNSGGGATTQEVELTGAIEPIGGQGQQGFSNKGTDFWTGYGLHEKISGADGSNNNAQMTLYFTADVASTVTIYVGSNLVETLTVPAGSVTASSQIPYSGANDARLTTEGVYANKGIYIHSTNPVVAYAEIYGSKVTAASVLFPVNTLGKSYTALNYTQVSNSSGNANARSYVFVVATQNNTTVQATLPTGVTSESGFTGSSTKTLNKGDVWLIKASDGTTDLTGTQIKSISSSGSSCQPIAVFSGSGKISITCDGSSASGDNIFQQCFPSVAWGRKYVSAPTAGTGYNNDIYRVMINPDYASTVVTVNGVTFPNSLPIPGITNASTTSPSTSITLTNNLYYEFKSSVPVVITSTSPVMVAQYITNASKCTNNYTGTGGDPDMIYLSAVEQTIDKIIVSPIQTESGNATNYINIVIKTLDASNFTIKDQNNALIPAVFVPIDATYSYAQILVAPNYSPSVYYNLACTSGGFNAISYGYASSESYAYNAGTNLVDLLSGFNVQNQFSAGASVAACKGSQFYMNVTLAFKPVSITWDFANNANLSPNASVTQTSADLLLTNVLIDSVQINGVWLYTYRIPTPYVYNAVGSFPVVINAVSPTPDGCNGIKTFTFPVTVGQGPTGDFSFVNTTGCLVPIQFNNTSLPNGYTIDQWQWDFVDPASAPNNTATIPNPIHSFSAGGTYAVKLRVITSEGCYADVTKNVSLSSVPVAAFTQSATTCANVAVPFNSTTSTIAPVGTISSWSWNFNDPASGGNNTATTQNPSHTFATANTYNVTLTVTSSTGCPSVVLTKAIVVSPSPTANFTFTNNGCASDAVTFNGQPNSMATYAWNFGETGSATNTSAVQNPTHQYATANTFNAALTVTSPQGCIGTVNKPVTLAAPLSNPAVTVTAIGSTSLTFTWTAVAGASGYQVSTDGINFVTPSSGATGLTHVVNGLTANQSITLTVKALGAIACQSTTGSATGLTLYPDVGLYIPNTFTPNGDGKNDVLKAYGNYLQKLNLRVFNQWGEKVFETSDVTGGWDGTYRGSPAAVGVYVYVVAATLPSGQAINKKGTVNLIR